MNEAGGKINLESLQIIGGLSRKTEEARCIDRCRAIAVGESEHAGMSDTIIESRGSLCRIPLGRMRGGA